MKLLFINLLHEVETNPVTGDVIENSDGWFWGTIKDGLVDFCLWLINGLFDILAPFVEWGCKLVIIWCVVSVFCTKDTKYIGTGLKFLLIYIIFFMIRSVI